VFIIQTKQEKNMTKTLISLATASLIATSAMAADKGVDFTTTGQAVVYYQTSTLDGGSDADLFNQKASSANVGVQLNLNADLGNNFAFGSQFTYLGTSGLEKNLVSGVRQGYTDQSAGLGGGNTTDDLALTKIFVAKKIANTTVKMGRQELPKSLSPFAFSEGWNVFKNTFDAILVVNSDLPDTTLVGAFVSGVTNVKDLTTVKNVSVNGVYDVRGAAYMVTAQNKSLPMATVTATYYSLSDIDATSKDADVEWVDVQIADKSLPMGLKVGLQGGYVRAEKLHDTSAMGIKVGASPIKGLKLCGAYTTVNDGTTKIQNVGGVKTPLYTQMVANQGAISTNNDTFGLKAVYSLGDMGTVIAQATQTNDKSTADKDNVEMDLLYKVKAGGVDMLAAYVRTDTDNDAKAANNIVRVVARYKF
jgi:hypothetical protein